VVSEEDTSAHADAGSPRARIDTDVTRGQRARENSLVLHVVFAVGLRALKQSAIIDNHPVLIAGSIGTIGLNINLKILDMLAAAAAAFAALHNDARKCLV
jgi:hypothetical protein